MAYCNTEPVPVVVVVFNPLWSGNPKMGTLANSEDLDEILHDVAVHQCLHCLLSQN